MTISVIERRDKSVPAEALAADLVITDLAG
jgi:hypothetical protein